MCNSVHKLEDLNSVLVMTLSMPNMIVWLAFYHRILTRICSAQCLGSREALYYWPSCKKLLKYSVCGLKMFCNQSKRKSSLEKLNDMTNLKEEYSSSYLNSPFARVSILNFWGSKISVLFLNRFQTLVQIL